MHALLTAAKKLAAERQQQQGLDLQHATAELQNAILGFRLPLLQPESEIFSPAEATPLTSPFNRAGPFRSTVEDEDAEVPP